MKKIFNNRGIALLMVLGSVMILTTVIVEFAFRTNVQYHLALNNADRLQAYYLAESAIHFSKLLIKYDQTVTQKLSKTKLDVQVEPLYRLFPLSSALLRGALQASGEGEIEETATEEIEEMADTGEEAEGDGSEGTGDEVGAALSMLQQEATQDFLSFSGDFELEVVEAESKIDLNIFYALPKTDPLYDARKRWLIALMGAEPFKGYFEKLDDNELTPATVTYALVDWIDQNDVGDELEGIERGSESDRYTHTDITPKSGKLTSLEEIGLVAGMTPALFGMLGPYLTIYNTNGLFNACLADKKLVQAFIVMASQMNTCVSPLDMEENSEQLEELSTSFLSGCPNPTDMVQLLNEAFGLGVGEDVKQGCSKVDLGQFLTDKRQVFELIGRGVVGDTTVEIRSVVDASGTNPESWPIHYWRVN